MLLRIHAIFPIISILAPTVVFIHGARAQLELRLALLETPVATPQNNVSTGQGRDVVSIARGAPISIRLELTNQDNRAVEIVPALDPTHGFIRLYMAKQGSAGGRFTTLRWEVKDTLIMRRGLSPGESAIHETFLFGRLAKNGSLEYLFPQPGEYTLYAQYEVDDLQLHLESNPVTVKVGPDVPAWEELKEAGIVDALEGRSRSDRERSDRDARIRSILRTLPENPYSPWLVRELRPGSESRVDDNVLGEVEICLRGFWSAYASGDVDACAAFLAADLVVNSSLNRTQALKQIADEIASRRPGGAPPEIDIHVDSAAPKNQYVQVTASIVIRQNSTTEGRRQVIQYIVRKGQDGWLISGWNRLSP